MKILSQIKNSIISGDHNDVSEKVEQAISDGIPPVQVLEEGLLSGMNVVGKKFKAQEIFLPEVLLAAKAMHSGMDLLKPFFEGNSIHTKGTIIMGTVKGDLHDLGKNLVNIMLRGAGFEVIDLGKDVSAEKFIDALDRSAAANDAA